MDHIWNPLAQGQPTQRYQQGQMIYLQATEATHLYYLISGTARSFILSEAGGERVLTIHRAGDLMGEASFFDRCPRVSSAMATSMCEVVSVDRDRLYQIFQNHPELAFPMLEHLARTVRTVTSHVDDMSFLRADQRVARYLLNQPRDANAIFCTHEEIGFSVGLNRVTVSRVLGGFSRQGWVKTVYRGVRILEFPALEALTRESHPSSTD